MNHNNLRDEADWYYSLGFNVTCIVNSRNDFNKRDRNLLKAPSHEWETLQNRRQSRKELNNYLWDKAIGVGTVLGHNGLMVIDIDGCVEEGFIQWLCGDLGLSKDYKWVINSGSGAGYHILIYCLNRPYIEAQRGWNFSTFGGVDNKGNSLNAYYPKRTLDELEGPYYDGDIEPYYISRSGGYKKEIYNEFISDDFLLTDLYQKIEFRWSNHLVLPPSLHSSGIAYGFLHEKPKIAPSAVSFKDLLSLQEKISLDKAEFSGWEGTADHCIAFEDGLSISQAKQKYKGIYSPQYMVLDIETNGLPRKSISHGFVEFDIPEIVQVAWIIVDGGGHILKHYDSIVKPDGYIISDESIEIHNIDNSTAQKLGKSLKAIIKLLFEDLTKINKVVSHNYEFDSMILIHHMKKLGFDHNIFEKVPSICTMTTSMKYFNFGQGNSNKYPKLSELYKALFAKSIRTRHNAIFDAILTKICYQKLNSYISGLN